jgi:serine/threonine-protein kinase
VTLTAGWLGGKIVHASIDAEWGTSLDPFAFRSPRPGDTWFHWFFLFFWSIVPIVAGVFFGVRNLRAGRGDRRGATVLAVFVFACYWIAHFIVQDVARAGILGTLDSMLDNAPLGHALMHAVTVWFVYVALEPYLRRLWPRILVSWARLVTGRYRDPLIGRDIIVGFVFAGVDAVLTLAATRLAPTQSTGPPFGIFDSLGGTGYLLAAVLYDAAISVLIALGFFSILLLARLVLRRNDLAVVVAVLVIGLATYFGNLPDLGLIGAAVAALGSVALAMVGVRFGLLAGFMGAFVRTALDMISWTTDLSAWYSGRMLLLLAVLAMLLMYGVATALAGKSIFKDPIQEGAKAA